MYIVVDLGATNLRVAIGKEKIIEKIIEEKTKGESENELINQIVKNIEKIKKNEKIEKICIASIGPINMKKGIIVNPPNIKAKNIEIVKILKQKFKVPVYLINDAIACVIAEKFYGYGKNFNNIVYITLSSGIGGGAIINGNLILGKDGNALHVGHIVIDRESKIKCGCGCYGHWEAFAGGKNIPNFIKYISKKYDYKNSILYKKSDGFKNLSSELLFECAKKNDKFSKAVIDEIGKINAIGIANVINMLDPEIIVLGGAIAVNNKNLILNPIKKYLKNYCINRLPKIKITKLKDIGLLGALAYLNFKSQLNFFSFI